ncbi:MAG: hypothetical protein DRP74_06390 [Candidatus Omnitrophota bacterium]|nr:MAG: hypothetical protein DRP74_06390 [Candidatus Omnitrophota bacterium]
MSDLEFIQRCVKGEKRAWDEFLDKYSRLIYKYIHGVLKIKGALEVSPQVVKDLFQEICTSLIEDNFKKLRSFKAKNNCSLASWLRQITINRTIDYIRTAKPTISIDAEIEGSDFSLKQILRSESPSAGQNLSEEENLKSLQECINRLSPEDKYFLELYFYQGLKLEEIKDLLRVTRGTVDVRKARIVERLRECFKSRGFIID